MDAILKTYNGGNLDGKIAIFLISEKSKKLVPETVTKDEKGNKVIAGEKLNKQKYIDFLNRNQLHYEEIVINQ